jgi:hypothetical protein
MIHFVSLQTCWSHPARRHEKERKKMAKIMIRVESETIEKLKQKFPDLAKESNATIVRICLEKLLEK